VQLGTCYNKENACELTVFDTIENAMFKIANASFKVERNFSE